MDEEPKPGADLQGGDEEARQQAARLMGKARTVKKINASRANVEKATEARRGAKLSEEHKAKIREARLKQEAEKRGGQPIEAAAKRPPGRPRKQPPEAQGQTGDKQA